MKYLILVSLCLFCFSVDASVEKKSIVLDTTKITEANVLYQVSSDEAYLYLQISTIDEKTAMVLVRKGVTVYFDLKGKESKDIFLKYPYTTNPTELRAAFKAPENSGEERKIDFNTIIEMQPNEAEYSYFDETQQFHKDLNGLDISIKNNFNPADRRFEIFFKIPINKITSKKNPTISNLSIGVISNKIERDKAEGGNKNQSGARKGGGQRGNGMRGGGMNRGGGKQGNRQEPKPNEQLSINFWFEANIK